MKLDFIREIRIALLAVDHTPPSWSLSHPGDRRFPRRRDLHGELTLRFGLEDRSRSEMHQAPIESVDAEIDMELNS